MTGKEDIDRVWRTERTRIVGALARRFGDVALAEDAVQEAFAAAARRWPVDGRPDHPGAWLTTTAYRQAVSMLRKGAPLLLTDDTERASTGVHAADDPATADTRVSDDDLFGLILACCHPALAREAQVALTLRHVAGLSVEEIAAAFVVAPETMAKRLVRARAKIKKAGIPFATPDAEALHRRVGEVRAVVYLVFNEGYLATQHPSTVRADLCEEAVWLGRHLRALLPDDETTGLLALMLAQHARRAERIDPTGRLVPIAEQDRSGWDEAAVEEARSLMSSTSGTDVGRYQVEAAIALLHLTRGEPSWAAIADLYGVLSRIAPSDVVEVHRAVAVGRSDGARAGLRVLAPLLAADTSSSYALLHVAHADLLERNGQGPEAQQAWRRAAGLLKDPRQVEQLRRRAARSAGGVGLPGPGEEDRPERDGAQNGDAQ